MAEEATTMAEEATTMPKFMLGQTYITSNARRRLSPEAVHRALVRHEAGDWGDVCPEDRAENDAAVTCALRILSVYHDEDGTKFWVITEADRSATTVLLPEDY